MATLFYSYFNKGGDAPKEYKKRFRCIPKYIPESAKEAFHRAPYCGAYEHKEEEPEPEEVDAWPEDTLANLGMDEKDFY